MNRIKTGDKVRVISGKYLNQEGIVLKVLPKQHKAVVEGINKAKVHKKASAQEEQGGIIEKELPLPWCKLALIAPKSTTGTSKIKFGVDKNGNKVRIAKKTNLEIESNKKGKAK